MSLYVFNRNAVDSDGTPYTETATVVAGDVQEAQKLLMDVLGGIALADADDTDVSPMKGAYSGSDSWSVEEVPIDKTAVVGIVATKWPSG